MNVCVICVGRLKESFYEEACREYEKRLKGLCRLEILELKRADNIATGNVSQELLDKFDRIEGMIRKIWQEAQQGQTCFCMKDLTVGGRDLIEAGIPEGPQIGEVLQKLLDEVIDGSLPNDRQALLEAAARVRQEFHPALK